MKSYLPSTEDGWLPLYILLVGCTAVGNLFQSYNRNFSYTQRVYSGWVKSNLPASQTTHATALSSRTFGTWNLLAGIVRLYGAYNLQDKSWYQLCMWTNVVGLFHFSMEAFVYGTCRPIGPWLAPVSVATLGLLWQFSQYDNYVKG